MAHFPPSFLDEVLAKNDLVEIISRHVQLKRAGSNMMGLCPFHHEKSPSFSVSPDKQLFYCFGCGKGGGAFQFLMEHDGYSFPEAVEMLAEKVGMEVPKDDARHDEDYAQRHRNVNVLEATATYFAQCLHVSAGEKATAYLQERALPAAIIQHYQLGYAPAGYGWLKRAFPQVQDLEKKMEAVGLMIHGERGYAERFRDRLMFPIRDRRGHVVGFGGRVLDADAQPKYLNSPETQVFHKSSLLYGLSEHRDMIRQRNMLLVVEGYMDVLGLAAHGFPIAVAPLGTAIAEQQIREILRLCASPVFCFDGDKAGRQAAWRALEKMLPLLKAEFEPKFLYLPEGEDPDSLVQQEGDTFARRIENDAKSVLDTWLMGLENMASRGEHGMAQMAKKADQMLSTMVDPFLRQAWQKAVEAKTSIRLSHVLQRNPSPMAKTVAAKPMQRLFEDFLLALLQKTERLLLLQDEDDNKILLDEGHAFRIFTRALELKQNPISDDIFMRELMLSFPEDTHISRWVNTAEISDHDFEGLLLAVRSHAIRRWLNQKKDTDLAQIVRLKRKMITLDEQRKYRGDL